MNIVIVGGGSVGSTICAQLAKEGHNITVVDSDFSAINEISNTCDVFGIVGNGADMSVLKKANADKADLVLAVASEDEINILCCIVSKKLGAKHAVARVRNPEYSELVTMLKKDKTLSMTINPEYAAAKELYRLLRFPAAAKIDTFCRGRVELAEITVTEDSSLCNQTLNDLRSKLNMRFLVCCVLRRETVYIPTGSFELQAGDTIALTAPEEEIASFFKNVGLYKQPVKDVLIVGGGRTTYYLEQLLEKSNIRSTVIEKNAELCRELAENFSCTVVNENGNKQDVLLAEGLDRTHAFLALSDVDEENAIISMYAKTQKVPKIVTLISAMPYVDFFKGVGLDSVVSPKYSTATFILRYVRSKVKSDDSEIESLHSLMNGKVEAVEFVVKDKVDGITDVPLKELKLAEGVLIACILHEDKLMIPSGNDCISSGDTVVAITSSGRLNTIKDILK